MKLKNFFYLILFLVTLKTNGQTEDKFKPYGKPVFLTFSNVHYSMNDNGNSGAFELTRLYLGYEHFFSESLSARANIDVGDPKVGDFEMTAYVKYAYLQYKKEGFSGRIGMISTDQFNLIEKHWGYRYIFKTFADQYSLGPSADLGAAVEYSPSKIISFDASFLNGEGYKKLQSDSAFKYTFGVTLRPVAGLVLRGYYDYMKKDHAQNTISLFAGYSYKTFMAGVEYTDQKNSKMIDGNDISGISTYISAGFAKRFSVFARYDNLWSSTVVNTPEDGQLFLGGIDFAPAKGIKIAPVYYGWLPDNSALPFTSTIGLYFEYRL